MQILKIESKNKLYVCMHVCEREREKDVLR